MSRKGRQGKSTKERAASTAGMVTPAILAPRGAHEATGGERTDEPPSAQPLIAESPPAEPFRRDDLSVPPVDIDAHFFEGPQRAWEPLSDLEVRDPRVTRKMSPTAARRRAHLARYVKVAVALSSVLCLAAVVKAEMTRRYDVPQLTATVAEQPVVVDPAAPKIPETPLSVGSPIAPAISAAPVSAEPVANAAPSTVASGNALAASDGIAEGRSSPPDTRRNESAGAPGQAALPSSATLEPLAPDPRAAAKAKAASANALERGNLASAIDSGERSVALDPTDGEAWLILGAAYQQKGDARGAVRSFKACLQQGKRGPKTECAAMLR